MVLELDELEEEGGAIVVLVDSTGPRVGAPVVVVGCPATLGTPPIVRVPDKALCLGFMTFGAETVVAAFPIT